MDKNATPGLNLSDIDTGLTGTAFPFFQPIISIEDKRVVGYEVLSRGKDIHGKTISLGYLFEKYKDSEISKSIDSVVREKAFEMFDSAGLTGHYKLFINMNPNWLNFSEYGNLSDMIQPLMSSLSKYSIQPENIVLEITEAESFSRPEAMASAVEYLKELGFAVAIDDFGSGYSNMNRIGLLKPKYIKLDLHLIRKGFSDLVYKEILNSMSFLSEKIGAILLVEGIEKEEELYGALDIGARYMQGYFLGYPADNFDVLQNINSVLSNYLGDFISRKLTQLQSLLYFKTVTADYFEAHLRELFLPEITQHLTIFKPMDPGLFPAMLREHLRLVFFINDRGVQSSPNYRLLHKEDGTYYWEENKKYINKDWSWRPYFMQFLSQKEVLETRKSYTDIYRDIQTGEPIVTLVYEYDQDVLLCLDFNISHIHNPLWHKA